MTFGILKAMFSDVVFLVLGLAVLIKGADILVDGASAIARKLRLSEWLIGITIVGIGTSIPEFAVTFFSNLAGNAQMGLGTVVGSNIVNILLILGVTAALFPLKLKKDWVSRDLLWHIASILAVAVAAFLFDSFGGFSVNRIEGAALTALFFVWFFAVIRNGRSVEPDEKTARLIAAPLSLIMVLGGLIGVVFGGNWAVNSAAAIAGALGLSQAFIGLTIMGLGTSLPELAVTFAAALKKRTAIAIGNIIGSNIFNFFFIIGISAMILPIAFNPEWKFDIMINAIAAVMLLAAVFTGRRYVLERWHGVAFVLAYAAYFIRIFVRELV